jgi:hypothetical protein
LQFGLHMASLANTTISPWPDTVGTGSDGGQPWDKTLWIDLGSRVKQPDESYGYTPGPGQPRRTIVIEVEWQKQSSLHPMGRFSPNGASQWRRNALHAW